MELERILDEEVREENRSHRSVAVLLGLESSAAVPKNRDRRAVVMRPTDVAKRSRNRRLLNTLHHAFSVRFATCCVRSSLYYKQVAVVERWCEI